MQWPALSLTCGQIERRRHVRRLTAARGALELERLERLRKLAGLLQIFRTLGSPAQAQISRTLRELTSAQDGVPPQPPTVPSWLPAVEPWRTVKEPQLPKHIIRNFLTPYEVFGRLDNSDVSEILTRDSAATFVSQYASQGSHTSPSDAEEGMDLHLTDDTSQTAAVNQTERDEDLSEDDEADVVDEVGEEDVEEDTVEEYADDAEASEPTPGLLPDNESVQVDELTSRLGESSFLETRHDPTYSEGVPLRELNHDASVSARMSATDAFRLQAEYTMPLPDAKEIPSALASLYYQFRQSLPKLAALPSTAPVAVSTELVTEEEKAALQDEAQTVHAMSKRQNELTFEESNFWEHLSDAEVSKLGADAVEHELAALAEKSNVISQSYERRTHPPTAETYEESKEILRAMGVPCLESTGPFEAEALASSLVIHGYADYVASEDTVRCPALSPAGGVLSKCCPRMFSFTKHR